MYFADVAEEEVVEGLDVGIGAGADEVGGGVMMKYVFEGRERGFVLLLPEIKILNIQNPVKLLLNLQMLDGVFLEVGNFPHI